MENYDNDIFNFDNTTNEDLNQANNFNFDNISGLGQSDYENEDLFSTEVESNESNYLNDYRIGNFENISNDIAYQTNITNEQNFEPFVDNTQTLNDDQNIDYHINNLENLSNELNVNSIDNNNANIDTNQFGDLPILNEEIFEAPKENDYEEPQFIQPLGIFEIPAEPVNFDSFEENEEVQNEENNFEPVNFGSFEDNEEVQDKEENNFEPQEVEEIQNSENNFEPEIVISETPIEELNKLTHFERERIEETDINSLFDKVSVNVKDASDIFRKNTDLKQKIDTRFEELKKLQSELENSRKKQIDEINAYKEEVLTKLTEKKEEIEKRLNILKESQATLEKEKKEFEIYKKKEQENIDKVQKEVQSAYDDRREELNHIEDVLRKQKDALDEERSQLSLDRIEYEADKNELANNLLKFNEFVNSFTNGMNNIKE